MEKKKKKAAGRDVRGRGELWKIFEFYALLATRFSLRLYPPGQSNQNRCTIPRTAHFAARLRVHTSPQTSYH